MASATRASTLHCDEVHRWLIDDGDEAFLDQDLYDGILAGNRWEQRGARAGHPHAVPRAIASAVENALTSVTSGD
jgi:hypothetical protein